jgi:hypothetical protein
MFGKWILIFGVFLVVAGAVVWLVESLGLRIGRLPSNIRMRGQGGLVVLLPDCDLHRRQHHPNSAAEPVPLVLSAVEIAK